MQCFPCGLRSPGRWLVAMRVVWRPRENRTHLMRARITPADRVHVILCALTDELTVIVLMHFRVSRNGNHIGKR